MVSGKFVFLNGLSALPPFANEKALPIGGAFMFCTQYGGLNISHTPRENAGLARVFLDSGLDKI
jgi:hypothetical protein